MSTIKENRKALAMKTRANRGSKRSSESRRGALTVEMAIVLPLFFLFLFATVEFGRMNMIRHTVDNAAYEAARTAIVPGGDVATAERVAQELLTAIGCRNTTVQVSPSIITDNTPEVTVTVVCPCDDNSYVANAFFKGKNLTGVTTLRRERINRF